MEPDGLTTVTLGNPEFEGENCAYILDRDGLAVVDPGISEPVVRDKLGTSLDDRGYSFADVEDVLVTHFHQDHVGLAGEIQAAGGASVYVHREDAPIVRGDDAAIDAMRDRQLERFDEWGMPERKQEAIPMSDEEDDAERLTPTLDDVTEVEHSESIRAGGFDLRVVHTPGHAAGHCCYEFAGDDGRHAFSGDAVLPVYTPNVGGSDTRLDNPLSAYLESLQRLNDRGYERFWPGHRTPIHEPGDRIAEIVDHHRERCERIISFLSDHGPADAWTVSADLFGSLDGIHIIHGPGEAFAHLEYLRDEGVLTRTSNQYDLRAETDTVAWDAIV